MLLVYDSMFNSNSTFINMMTLTHDQYLTGNLSRFWYYTWRYYPNGRQEL
jgi:hypothetical protein